MVVPLGGRIAAAVIGGLLVLTAGSSVIGTLIVTRSVSGRLTRFVDWVAERGYWLALRRVTDYRRRDRMLATQPAAILIMQLIMWVGVAYTGFALLLWPFATKGIVGAFTDAGSSMFTLGFAEPAGAVPAAIVFLGAGTGLVILTLQIAYLPTLY